MLERRLGNIDSDIVDVKTKEYGDITVFKDFENTQDLPLLISSSSKIHSGQATHSGKYTQIWT